MTGLVRFGLMRVVNRLLSVRLKPHLRAQFSTRFRPPVVRDLSADITSVLKPVLSARLNDEFSLQFSPGVTLPFPT